MIIDSFPDAPQADILRRGRPFASEESFFCSFPLADDLRPSAADGFALENVFRVVIIPASAVCLEEVRLVKVRFKQLIEAGVHFGHQRRKWNPRMAPYVLCRRKGVDMIDLRKTVKELLRAKHLLAGLGADGGEFLFVGTKLAASEAVREAAERCGMHYVNYRWLGGTLTNFSTVLSRIDELRRLERLENEGLISYMTKKELARFYREKGKMTRNLQGIRRMTKLPAALVVIDPINEKNAVTEANRMEIPIIAIIDTDGDPDEVDVAIAANDESVHAIRLIIDELVDAILQGKEFFKKGPRGTAAAAEKSAEESSAGPEPTSEESGPDAEADAAAVAGGAEGEEERREEDKSS